MTVSTFAPDFDYNDASKTLNVDKVDVLGASFEAADGTTPFTVTSTTKVTNLNADKIDGLDSTDFLKVANNLSDITNAGTARTNLGLGSVDNTADTSKPVSTAAQAALALKAPLASPTFTGTVTVPAPVNATDASTKGYADALKQGLDIKDSVRVASTVNIPILTGLVNLSVIDGVTVSTGDRVLLKNQTAPAENGIWVVVASGAASRSLDANDSAEVTSGLYVFVSDGSASAGTGFVLTTADPIALGTTPLVFTAFSGAGQIIAGNGLSESGNTLSINTAVTVDLSTAQTLTNKSISGGQITSAVANATLAATATALQTARTIGGTSFDGTANITISSVEASAGTALLPSIAASGDLNTGVFFPAADTVAVSTGGSERFRVDNSGRILVGSGTSRSLAGIQPNQFESTTSSGGVSIIRNSADATGPTLSFAKTRSTSVGGVTITQSGDILGSFLFFGADGVDMDSWGASILAAVDGTPGSNDMPGRLVFSTTTSGATSPVERMRIDRLGNVGIGTTAPGISAPSGKALTIESSGVNAFEMSCLNNLLGTGNEFLCHNFYAGSARNLVAKIGVNISGSAENAADILLHTAAAGILLERFRITSAGNVGIGTTPNANAILDVNSTTKAFMPPRMTTTQKNAIASPTAGMLVYDSTLNKLSLYTTAWETVTSI